MFVCLVLVPMAFNSPLIGLSLLSILLPFTVSVSLLSSITRIQDIYDVFFSRETFWICS